MKKIFVSFLFLILITLSQTVLAKDFSVIAITQNDFSTINTNNELSVKIVGKYEIAPNQYISDGTILSGNVVETVSAKKNNRDAFAYIQFTKFQLPHQNKPNTITTDFAIAKISQYTQLNLEKLKQVVGVHPENPISQYLTYPINCDNSQASANFESKTFTPLKTKGNELNLPQGSYILLTFTNNI